MSPTVWTENSGPAQAFTEGVSGPSADLFIIFLLEGTGGPATSWTEPVGPAAAFTENTGPAGTFVEQGT